MFTEIKLAPAKVSSSWLVKKRSIDRDQHSYTPLADKTQSKNQQQQVARTIKSHSLTKSSFGSVSHKNFMTALNLESQKTKQ